MDTLQIWSCLLQCKRVSSIYEICKKEKSYREASTTFFIFYCYLLKEFTSVWELFALAEYECFQFRVLAKNYKKTKTSCTLFITCINRIIIKVCKKNIRKVCSRDYMLSEHQLITLAFFII